MPPPPLLSSEQPRAGGGSSGRGRRDSAPVGLRAAQGPAGSQRSRLLRRHERSKGEPAGRGGSEGLSALVMEVLRDCDPLERLFAGAESPEVPGPDPCALCWQRSVFSVLSMTVKVPGLWFPRGALRSSALAPSPCHWRCSAGSEQVIGEMGLYCPTLELDSSAATRCLRRI